LHAVSDIGSNFDAQRIRFKQRKHYLGSKEILRVLSGLVIGFKVVTDANKIITNSYTAYNAHGNSNYDQHAPKRSVDGTSRDDPSNTGNGLVASRVITLNIV